MLDSDESLSVAKGLVTRADLLLNDDMQPAGAELERWMADSPQNRLSYVRACAELASANALVGILEALKARGVFASEDRGR